MGGYDPYTLYKFMECSQDKKILLQKKRKQTNRAGDRSCHTVTMEARVSLREPLQAAVLGSSGTEARPRA